MRLGNIIGKKIYTTSAEYFSDVDDFLIEIGKGGGEVLGLKVKKTRKGVIPFEKVTAVGDIILVDPK